MNVFARYAVFILVMGIIIVSLASLAPNAYKQLTGIVRVAKIPIHSFLSVDSDLLSGVTGVDSIISRIKSADSDPEIKAILLDINSGGGGAVASYELAKTIQQVSKPVISVIREVGASGAYWAAISSDYVFANELSTVGSVGVTASYLVFEGLMDKYGISEVRAVSGELKDFGSPYRNLTLEEADELNRIINITARVFIDDFLILRNVTSDVLEQVITGKIFLGTEAFELGLVDGLGTLDDVDDYLMLLLDSKVIEYVEYSETFSLLDLLAGVKTSPLNFASERLILNS